jgi:hypothetical protein
VWVAVTLIVAAALLGVHAWRGLQVLREAVPDPARETAVRATSLARGPIAVTLFVPDCAEGVLVRFDPSAPRQGDVSASLALNEPGNRFASAPMFRSTARLESLTDGVWMLHPPMDDLRGRFVRLQVDAGPDARAAVSMRSARPPDRNRANLDERWALHASPIAGAYTATQDALPCIATSDPMPRWLAWPTVWCLGAVWLLTIVTVAWWMWPSRDVGTHSKNAA